MCLTDVLVNLRHNLVGLVSQLIGLDEHHLAVQALTGEAVRVKIYLALIWDC